MSDDIKDRVIRPAKHYSISDSFDKQIADAYLRGQQDMRERAAKAVRLAVHMAVGFRASHIVRSLPILPLDADETR